MSHQRTRAGRKGASEGQPGSARGDPEHVQSPRQGLRNVRSQIAHGTEAVRGQEQRQSRGSAVHSILNPSSPLQGSLSYAGSHPQVRPSVIAAENVRVHEPCIGDVRLPPTGYERRYQEPDELRTTARSLTHLDRERQHDRIDFLQRPSLSAVEHEMRTSERSNTIPPFSTSVRSLEPVHAQSTPPSRPATLTLDPQVFLSGQQPSSATSSYSVASQQSATAGITRTPPRSISFQQAGTGSFTLASDVGQLDIRRQPTGNSSPVTTRSAYRYHTLQTEQGPVSFPLEIQSASRVADEKRRRNAGASARFRARRKEKEQASSKEIDDLRQEIMDLEEDVEFYRGERDYLAAQLYNNPNNGRQFPRPISPRRRRPTRPRRLTETLSVGSGGREETTPQYQMQGGHETEARHTRRRLSQKPYEDFAEPILPAGYPPQRPPYEAPRQGHSYGPLATAQHLPPHQSERSYYEQRQQYQSQPSSSAPSPPRTSSTPHHQHRG